MSEAAVAVKPSRTVSVNPSRVSESEFAQQKWIVTAEPGTVIDDLEKAEYWAHNAARFKVGDRIEVRSEYMSWMVEMIVLQSGQNWARVKTLQTYKFDDETDVSSSKYSVVWRGPHLKFCVERTGDNARIKDGCTKEEAQNWILENDMK